MWICAHSHSCCSRIARFHDFWLGKLAIYNSLDFWQVSSRFIHFYYTIFDQFLFRFFEIVDHNFDNLTNSPSLNNWSLYYHRSRSTFHKRYGPFCQTDRITLKFCKFARLCKLGLRPSRWGYFLWKSSLWNCFSPFSTYIPILAIFDIWPAFERV